LSIFVAHTFPKLLILISTNAHAAVIEKDARGAVCRAGCAASVGRRAEKTVPSLIPALVWYLQGRSVEETPRTVNVKAMTVRFLQLRIFTS
jgi:hypothetical protein